MNSTRYSWFMLLSLLYTVVHAAQNPENKRVHHLQKHSVVWSCWCRCKVDVLFPYTLQSRSKDIASTQAQRHLQHSCHERCEGLALTIRGLEQQIRQTYAAAQCICLSSTYAVLLGLSVIVCLKLNYAF